MKNGKFILTVCIVCIALFLAAAAAPLTALMVGGTNESAFEGEKQYSMPDFSVKDYFSGKFAADFNTWFSKNYPGRGALLQAYSRLKYKINTFSLDFPSGDETPTQEPTGASTVPTEAPTEAPTTPRHTEYTLDNFNNTEFTIAAGSYTFWDLPCGSPIENVSDFERLGYITLTIDVPQGASIGDGYFMLGDNRDFFCVDGSNSSVYNMVPKELQAGRNVITARLIESTLNFGSKIDSWEKIDIYRILLFNKGSADVTVYLSDFKLVIPHENGPHESNYSFDEMNAALAAEIPRETKGFRGDDVVSVGKNGYLYSSAYVDEVFGLMKSYRTVDPRGFYSTAESIKYAQEELSRQGKAVIFYISPSKAYEMSQFVGDWYLAQFEKTPDDYVRGVDKLRKALNETGTSYVDSTVVFKEVGLKNTFAKTGIHWNPVASFTVVQRIIADCELLSGRVLRHLTADRILKSPEPMPCGNSDKDIYHLVYNAINYEGAIQDEFYYKPDAYVEDTSVGKVGMFSHGGSFSNDVIYWLTQYGVVDQSYTYFYSTPSGGTPDVLTDYTLWGEVLPNVDIILFECNELAVGSATSGGPFQRMYEGLARYLRENPAD